MALSQKERSALHRSRQRAKAFADDYLDGAEQTTYHSFLRALERKVCVEQRVGVAEIEKALEIGICDRMKDMFNIDIRINTYELYDVADFWRAYEKAFVLA